MVVPTIERSIEPACPAPNSSAIEVPRQTNRHAYPPFRGVFCTRIRKFDIGQLALSLLHVAISTLDHLDPQPPPYSGECYRDEFAKSTLASSPFPFFMRRSRPLTIRAPGYPPIPGSV